MLKWISTRDMSREDWLKARKQGIDPRYITD